MTTSVDIYDKMVTLFNKNNDKKELVKIMTDYCERIETTPDDIYNLKKNVEINFSQDVNCRYCYLTKTPIDYGCDLREIFYDRNGTLIDGGERLLQLFQEKKLPEDVWHIMTDIDDTLYAHLAGGIAGSDISWHQKKPYPGIKLFYNLFYKKLDETYRYTTILSATPGCGKNKKLKDTVLHDILHNYGFIQGSIEGKRDVLPCLSGVCSNVGNYVGTKLQNKVINTINSYADTVTDYQLTVSETDTNTISDIFKSLGETKFKRFEQYIKIFPEYKILFIGDNGQGDVFAGKKMLEKYHDKCYVFIHKVSVNGHTFTRSTEEYEDIPHLYFFTNYYELALNIKDAINMLNENDVRNIKTTISRYLSLRENKTFRNLYPDIGTYTIGGIKKKTLKYKIKKYKTKKSKQNKKTKKHTKA